MHGRGHVLGEQAFDPLDAVGLADVVADAYKPDPRAALLEAGARLFTERGFDGVSIEDIAAEAGLAKGLLYYYFVNKRALYVEIVRASADELAACTAPDPALPPAQRTAAVLTAVIEWAKTYGKTVRMLLAQGSGAEPELRTITRET